MNKTNKISRKYIRQVKRHLKCSSKKRKEFLDTLTPEVYNFEIENPNAEYADYVKVFGSPKSAAKEYMKVLSFKERLIYWSPLIGIATAVFALAYVILLVFIIIQMEADRGYAVVDSAIEVTVSDISNNL